MDATQDTLNPLKAGLQEIFSSIQGEGLYVGKRQIFVRFNACHLKCAYCDTPQKPAAEKCQVEIEPGTGKMSLIPNPMPVEQVAEAILLLNNQAKHNSISFTGGEPLLYTEFLKQLLPLIRPSLPIYIETSGTQPKKLLEIMDWVDIVAMDIKLPSATKEPMLLEAHQAFYQVARQKDCFIKLVFCEETPFSELDAARVIVTDKAMPIYLQPMTDLQTGENTVSATKILAAETYLSQYFDDVRVVPQTHKMLQLL